MWYVRSKGRVSGPYSIPQLRDLRRTGRFSSVDQVSRDQIQWSAAREIMHEIDGAGAPAGPPTRGGPVTRQSTVDWQGTAALATRQQQPQQQQQAAPPAEIAAPREEEDWHFVGADRAPSPGVSMSTLVGMLRGGQLPRSALVLRRGETNWLPANKHPQLAGHLPSFKLPRSALLAGGAAGGAILVLFVGWMLIGLIVGDRRLITSPTESDKVARAVGTVVSFVEVELADQRKLEIPASHGTCFVVDPVEGHAITNRHVTEAPLALLAEATKVFVGRPVRPKLRVVLRRVAVDCKLVHTSAKYDLSILKLERVVSDQPYFALKQAEPADLSEVFAAGYPGVNSLAASQAEAFVQSENMKRSDLKAEQKFAEKLFQHVMTSGRVSRVVKQGDGELVIDHTATIAGGNSGGPLFLQNGRVVGINTFTLQNKERGERTNNSPAIGQMRGEIDQVIGGNRVRWE